MKPSSLKCKHPWNVLFPGVIKSKQSSGESEDVLTLDFPGS